MEFYDVMKSRRSIRAFRDTPVEEEKLQRILEAGRLAPSWCNRQCWRFIVVRDQQQRNLLGEVLGNPSAKCYEDAPVVIAVCAEPSDSGTMEGKEYYLVDCAIALEHMVLAAAGEGLGSCWVGAFRESAVHNVLGIPREVKVVGILPLGYPDETPNPTPRKPLEEIVYWDGWRKPE